MARIAVVTDSTSDLSPAQRQAYGITMVPLNVHFEGEVYRDQIDLTSDEFMARLQRAEELPTTSAPSAGLFEETFRRLAATHDGIVAVTLSAKLSATMQSALIAKEAVADVVPVEVVDSLNASMGLGLQVLRAAELVAEGRDLEEIARTLTAETANYHLVFFVDTLEYLQRGGRIGRAASLVGSLLKLKPILRIDEGQVVPFERTRTQRKALEGLRDFVRGFPQIERLAVCYSTTTEEASRLADELGAFYPRERIILAQFGPVIGTHVGPGAIGVCVFEGGAT